MAIQFDCVGCGKPVEVDDQWGGRLVECPYCHDTITAPAYPAHASRAPAPAFAPPVGHEPAMHSTGSPPPTYAGGSVALRPLAGGSNRIAVVALVLAILSLVAGFAALVVVGTVATRDLGMQPTEEEMNAYVQQAMTQGAPWLLGVGLAGVASFGLWLAGLICGIVGVCRPRRGVAIAALVMLSVPFVVLFVSILLT